MGLLDFLSNYLDHTIKVIEKGHEDAARKAVMNDPERIKRMKEINDQAQKLLDSIEKRNAEEKNLVKAKELTITKSNVIIYFAYIIGYTDDEITKEEIMDFKSKMKSGLLQNDSVLETLGQLSNEDRYEALMLWLQITKSDGIITEKEEKLFAGLCGICNFKIDDVIERFKQMDS